MGLEFNDLELMDFAEVHEFMCEFSYFHNPKNQDKMRVRKATQADIDRL